jgi:glycosyltransferase involved in cell wall biosynthesis
LDDESNDGSAEAVEELSAKVTMLRTNGAWWWGGALDHGYRWLRLHVNDMDDIVLMIDDDTCASET